MSKVPTLTLEDMGIPTTSGNREHIKRIYQALDYLTGQIADIKIMVAHLKEMINVE